MFHKIKDVQPLPDHKLNVYFSEGQRKLYDIVPLSSEHPLFKDLLTDDDLFNSVQVDVGGFGIIWNDELDLSCDELWENGQKVDSPFDGLMSLRDATEMWGLNESTLRRAIIYGRFLLGIDVCKFGKQWVISYESMLREYGEPKAS
ncbi:Protein of unknown function [Pseudobutyrivibrio sp. UC1225]|uniref:DUF2442 domain-containing protein n=1 Tax=Pseudobutyrivibrio sp. UC1225 TaxID=1798185 RepID=UPI0008E4BB8B|nr:DUF2442 domain-containing protein [Pseudobutyrivibrio sp. UC1225]SFN60586.1 Protein of unknown function [Pseudobutyrivibrio sp. UC1225]